MVTEQNHTLPGQIQPHSVLHCQTIRPNSPRTPRISAFRVHPSTREHTSRWFGGSVANQSRVDHNSTRTLVGVLSRNLCGAIIRSLDTNGCTSRSLILTNIVVSIHKDSRIGTVIADRKVVSLCCASANKAILVSDSSGRVAVEDTLVGIGSRLEKIIEEGGCGIQGDVRIGKAGTAVVVSGA